MDACQLSPYPHYSWIGHWLAICPPRVLDVFQCRSVAHRIILTTHGAATLLWKTGYSEITHHAATGDICFFPCDGGLHTVSITASDEYRAYSLLVPKGHVRHPVDPDNVRPCPDHRVVPLFHDTLLQASLLRLSSSAGGRAVSEELGDDVAARHVVTRLCVLVGATRPEWQTETNVFTPSVMRQIVERIDAHLFMHESLEFLARGFGLSAGHFARKFQQSTGNSLQRFVNRRRIGMSFTSLQELSLPLSRIALDLGFSSQSHFTRLFSGLTGLTPQQFRQMHLRMSGPTYQS
jgi:AraC-like DNA-binding protein